MGIVTRSMTRRENRRGVHYQPIFQGKEMDTYFIEDDQLPNKYIRVNRDELIKLRQGQCCATCKRDLNLQVVQDIHGLCDQGEHFSYQLAYIGFCRCKSTTPLYITYKYGRDLYFYDSKGREPLTYWVNYFL